MHYRAIETRSSLHDGGAGGGVEGRVILRMGRNHWGTDIDLDTARDSSCIPVEGRLGPVTFSNESDRRPAAVDCEPFSGPG